MTDVSDLGLKDVKEDFTEALPSGEYLVSMVDSNRFAKKDGSAEFVGCTFRIESGEMIGEEISLVFPVVHEKSMTVRIAKINLKKICEACGNLELAELVDIYGINFMLKIGTYASSSGDRNTFKDAWPAPKTLESRAQPSADDVPF